MAPASERTSNPDLDVADIAAVAAAARAAENAAALVAALRGHPAVSDVRWPGHPADPAHDIAARQMRRWNGVLRFTLASEDAVGRFLAASTLVGSATSFGGYAAPRTAGSAGATTSRPA